MIQILTQLRNQFPQATLYGEETPQYIEINYIRIPPELRNRGIGSQIIQTMQNYATYQKKPILIEFSPEKNRTQDLRRFYNRHGFIKNEKENRIEELYKKYAVTMYWLPELCEAFRGIR